MDMEVDEPHQAVELPHDDILWYQILKRLPVKSLMRFKCVTKYWFSAICSLSFATAHLNFHRNNNKKKLLFYHHQNGWFSSHIHIDADQQEGDHQEMTPFSQLSNITADVDRWWGSELASIRWWGSDIASINGVVCVSSYLRPFVIFNPTTHECFKIEIPRASATTASKYRPTYHFGFSPRTNEYKVLRVARRNNGSLNHLKIFRSHSSSSHRRWRSLRVKKSDDLSCGTLNKCPFEERNVGLHGAIHWVHKEENIMVVFDVAEEKFGVIPLPDCDSIDSPYALTQVRIFEVGGCVAVYGKKERIGLEENEMEEDGMELVFWILKDYENGVWVKETIIMCEKTNWLDYPPDWDIAPLCTIENNESGGELLLVFMAKPPCKSPGYDGGGPPILHLYNMNTKLFNRQYFIFPAETSDDDEDEDYCYCDLSSPYRLVTSYDDSIVSLR